MTHTTSGLRNTTDPIVRPAPVRRWLPTVRVAPGLLVFAAALLLRLLWSSVPVGIDEDNWMRRGAYFVGALVEGNPAGTYLRHHPGVTNMWTVGLAYVARYGVAQLMPLDELARQSGSLAAYLRYIAHGLSVPVELYTWVRFFAAVITAAASAGIYALSRRLFGGAIAGIATVILLFEPFYLAYQRSITTDANQSNFTWLALLAFLLYMQTSTQKDSRTRMGWLLFSAVCFGLALLSKVAALLSLPALGLWALWWTARRRSGAAWGKLVRDMVLWSLVVLVVCVLLWPALWADLPGTIGHFRAGLSDELDGHQQFLFGRTTDDPGFTFYPVVLAFRLSPLLLVGTVLGTAALFWPAYRHRLEKPELLAALGVNVVIVLVGITLSSSKIDRYIVPLMPGLALWVAACLCAVGGEVVSRYTPAPRCGERDLRPRVGLGAVGLVAVGVVQLAVLLPHYPYNLTYFNPLLGGPPAAERVMMVGNGEMLDRAAVWLNTTAGTDALPTVSSWYGASLLPYYRGPLSEMLLPDPADTRKQRLTDVDYVLLYVNQFQRMIPPAEYYRPQTPVYTVQAHGIDYVRIYPGPLVRPEQLAQVSQRTDFDFGGYARLLGYELLTPQVAAGEIAAVALYWQAEQPFPVPDYTVYTGVHDAAGNRYGRTDSPPGGGYLPVDGWQTGQVIRDVQQVQVVPGTPPGEYQLEISFYSAQQGQQLEIRGDDGPQGTQVALTTVQVTKPPSASAAASDLRVGSIVNKPIGDSGLRLLGYDWASPDVAQAGRAYSLGALWQAGVGTPGMDLYLRLSDGVREWRRQTGHPLGGSYAPAGWSAGELVRDVWQAVLPVGAPPGRYHLDLIADTMNGTVPVLDLGEIALQDREHRVEPAAPVVSQQVDLGKTARFLGYDFPSAIHGGETVELTLYWQALTETERSYVRFVHLLNPADRIVVQQDTEPGNGRFFTTGWVPGEILTETAQLALPAELALGRYRLAVGLYDQATGQRLLTADGADHIALSEELEVR